MILRMEYERSERGKQKQEYSLCRFQNYAKIMKQNANGFHDFLDFKAKVSPTYTR